jgi:hypothetical protein
MRKFDPRLRVCVVAPERTRTSDLRFRSPIVEGLSVGYDYGDTVDHENYTDSFPFTGTVKKVTYDVSGDAIHDAEAVARRLLGRQ